MWTEQYRPVSFDQVINQDNVVNSLKQVLSTGNIPHMLFYGPQGVGKSSVVNALAHEIFGPKYAKERVFEINASSDRGIDVVRSRIKEIAQRKVSEIPNALDNNTRSVPAIQLIVLEEADALTRDAQAALRRIIEDYSKYTRIILCCNYPSQIITPILSRCARYKFNKMNQQSVIQQLRKICNMQQIEIDEQNTNPLELIALASNSDMRKAVTMLQMCCQLCQYKQSNVLTVDDVNVLLIVEGIPNQQQLLSIIEGIKACPPQQIMQICNQVNEQNYNSMELINRIFNYYVQQCQESNETNSFLVKLGQLYEQCGKYMGLGGQEDAIINKFIIGLKTIQQ